MMVSGFFMVYRTNWFLDNFGDIGGIFGVYNASWASWKGIGLGLLWIGFMVAFGLLQIFLRLTLGRFFLFGGI